MGAKKLFGKPSKVDLSNPDKEEISRMILAYQESRSKEVPLIINDNLTIMVPPDKCNDRYRRRYIQMKNIK